MGHPSHWSADLLDCATEAIAGGPVVWRTEGLPCTGQGPGKIHHLAVTMELELSLKESEYHRRMLCSLKH